MDNAAQQIRILIADNQAMFRDALRTLLEQEPDLHVVGEASNGRDAVEQAGSLKPDVMLLDLIMPQLAGMEALRKLAKGSFDVRIIVFADSLEKRDTIDALRLGARGVLSKHTTTKQLLCKSIRAVASGEYWIGHRDVSSIVDCLRSDVVPERKPGQADSYRLTPREIDIVTLIVDGYTNKEIAHKLSISEQTVKHHLTSIYEKAGVTNRMELALLAVRQRFDAEPQ